MNKDQLKTSRNDSQKKAWTKSNGTKKPASLLLKDSVQETSSNASCSSDVITIEASTMKNNLSSKISEISENKSKNVETLILDSKDKPEDSLTRDEIVLRRKLKVAARKKIKKLEKLQITQKDFVEKGENPRFSLQLASEDFPTLNEMKIKKRTNIANQETLTEKDSTERTSKVNEAINCKVVEKSWKPKVKDPIHIDLSQALLNKNEKHKPVPKKTDPQIQRNLLAGNILDSDNPTRKKGKVRPDKLQKPSKLKSHILNERKKKVAEIKENNSVISECFTSKTSEIYEQQQISTEVKSGKNDFFTNYDFTEPLLPVDESKVTETKKNEVFPIFKIHSRRFREYCTNCLTEEVITSVCALLEKVAYFQDRLFLREPIKASAKRRYVAGINQVTKYLRVRKVKLLVIAPDLEKNPGEGGLDEKVEYFKAEAESQGIPCVFGPNRKRLGKAVKKNTLVSCVAILSYEGAEELYAQVLEALNEGKTKYLRLSGNHEDDSPKDLQDFNQRAADESDVTSSLLARLREEPPPAERLMKAIQRGGPEVEE